MWIVVSEAAIAAEAPGPQTLPRSETHRMELTTGYLLDENQRPMNIPDLQLSGPYDILATVKAQRSIASVAPRIHHVVNGEDEDVTEAAGY